MSTNPSNAIGTNGAYGGRTSVEALNDILNVFTGGGIVRGWECSPSSGMTVALGGVSGYRDVAIAVSPTGTRTTINNRTTSPVNVTLSTAPASNSRIDVIVAYVQNPPQGSTTVVDNPAACGIIPVSGTVSSSPTAPSDSDIRSAITADGATGSTAYYVVLATIAVASGVTTITSNYITQGAKAALGTNNIDFTSLGEAGEWVKVGEVTLTSDTTGQSFFEVDIPSEFQGARCSYKIECAAEVGTLGSGGAFPALSFKLGNTWASDEGYYSFIGYRNNAVANTSSSGSAICGIELQFASSNDHCVLNAIVSRAGASNYWCTSGTLGGTYRGAPSSIVAGGGASSASAITALRFLNSSSVTLRTGSHMTVWARKY